MPVLVYTEDPYLASRPSPRIRIWRGIFHVVEERCKAQAPNLTPREFSDLMFRALAQQCRSLVVSPGMGRIMERCELNLILHMAHINVDKFIAIAHAEYPEADWVNRLNPFLHREQRT
jgi:hypothetical protein